MNEDMLLENEELKAKVERLENTQDLIFAFMLALQGSDNKVDLFQLLSSKNIEKIDKKLYEAERKNSFEKKEEFKLRQKLSLNKIGGR